MIPASVAEFRARYRSWEIGQRYSGWAHFAFTSIVSLAIVAWSASGVRGATWGEWLTVPLTFLFANAAEYFGHKGPMHRPRRGLSVIYKRHTLQHHHFFTNEAMSYEASRDFKMVLFPPYLVLFFFGLFAVPVGAVLWTVASANVARFYVATAVGYFLTYEWLHFAYHLDENTFVGRLGLVRRLRHHHQTHHDLALMGKWNFNITFPICDWIFGTSHEQS
jgi:hypothetical protein